MPALIFLLTRLIRPEKALELGNQFICIGAVYHAGLLDARPEMPGSRGRCMPISIKEGGLDVHIQNLTNGGLLRNAAMMVASCCFLFVL